MKMMAVWYLLLGISSIFKGETNAYFSDREMINGVIRAGTWENSAGCSNNEKHGNWDCSSLKFKKDVGITDQTIYATIVNNGSDMESEGRYAVYYNEKGNPKKGEMLTEILTFNALKKGESIILTFTPERNGVYMFKALQHEDHPGKGELWSKEIKVNFRSALSNEEEFDEDSNSDLERNEETEEADIPIEEEIEIEDKGDLEKENEETEQSSQPKESMNEGEQKEEEVSSENNQSDSDLDVNEENQKAEIPNEEDSGTESQKGETEQLPQPEESINKEKQEQSVEEKVKTEAEEPSKDDADAKIEEVELDKKDTDEQVKGE